jgi:uncharacterized protein YegL
MTSKNSQQLAALINGSGIDGMSSNLMGNVLTGHLGSLVIAGAAGVAAENIQASEVTLMTVLIDSSSSIKASGLEAAVRDGQNALVNALRDSKEADSILLALWTFDTTAKVVHSYVPLADVTRLDDKNYQGSGTTHLYDTWCAAITANVAYAEDLRKSGTPVRSIVVVVTDGEDVGSKSRVDECRRITDSVLRTEQFHLAFVGVGNETDFRRVAREMGLADGSVLVQKDATPSEIRKVFGTISKSAIRASQGLVKPGATSGFFT